MRVLDIPRSVRLPLPLHRGQRSVFLQALQFTVLLLRPLHEGQTRIHRFGDASKIVYSLAGNASMNAARRRRNCPGSFARMSKSNKSACACSRIPSTPFSSQCVRRSRRSHSTFSVFAASNIFSTSTISGGCRRSPSRSALAYCSSDASPHTSTGVCAAIGETKSPTKSRYDTGFTLICIVVSLSPMGRDKSTSPGLPRRRLGSLSRIDRRRQRCTSEPQT